MRLGVKSFRFTYISEDFRGRISGELSGMSRKIGGGSAGEWVQKARLEDDLEEGLPGAALAANVVAPHVNQKHVRGRHGEERGLLLEGGVVLAALAAVRALSGGGGGVGRTLGGVVRGRCALGARAAGGASRAQLRGGKPPWEAVAADWQALPSR